MNRQKAAIIGCGFVGSSTAFALMQKGLFSELVLIDADQKKAHGEAADIAHGRPFAHMMQIYAGDYSDIGDCGLIIITAGAAQKPGESRTCTKMWRYLKLLFHRLRLRILKEFY